MTNIPKTSIAGVLILLMFSIVVIIFLPLYQEYHSQQYPKITLNSENSQNFTDNNSLQNESSIKDKELTPKSETQDSDILQVGMSSLTSGRESLYYYNDLLEQLENHIDKPVEIQQARTHSEMNELIVQGQVDIAFICSFAYTNLQDNHDISLLAAPQINGSATHHSVIIAKNELDINSFQDLENHSFAYTDPLSNTGKLYPLYMLKRQGLNSEDFFEHSYFTYSHNNSLESVIEGVVDAAAVDSLVYDQMIAQNPDYFDDISLVHTSPSFKVPPLVASPELEPELKDRIKGFFLEFDQSSEGEYILKQLGIDQFIKIEDEDYDSIREMAEVVSNAE